MNEVECFFLCLCAASEHRKLVAAGLWQTGYHADWIYERGLREGGEEGRFSSRDLLLALGWLLAIGTLEKLLTQRVQQLDKTLLTPTPVRTAGTIHTMLLCVLGACLPFYSTDNPNSVLQYNFISLISASVFQVNPQISPEVHLHSASLRRLQWLIGCLRHQGRILLSMQDERASLLHAVRKSPVSNLLKGGILHIL